MRVFVYTVLLKGSAYLRSAFHYRTVWHLVVAFGRGIYRAFHACIRFVNADNKKELREANPTEHHKEVIRRRYFFATGLLLWTALWTIVYTRIGTLAPTGAVLLHTVLLIWIGRTDVLLERVQTARMAGEMLIRSIVDDITLTVKAVNDGATSSIYDPPSRIRSNKGYTVTVRVHNKGNPDALINGAPTVAHKLQRGLRTVFCYEVPGDASLVKILVLDSDPWAQAPTESPIVANPRLVNLFREKVDLGTLPTYERLYVPLAEEGDGGGMIVGGSPRRGKSVFLSAILAWIMCDPRAEIHIVDGSAVDYAVIRSVCASFVGDEDMEDIDVLRKAHKVLKNLKVEVNRRKRILFAEKASRITEEIALKHGLGTVWYVIDELAVLTEDLYATHKQEVEEFLADLHWYVRGGPKYGMFSIFATQRPSNRSMPATLTGLVVNRIAFYIANQSGSLSILGKGGNANRADKLDPKQKGVAIWTGHGQFRSHRVLPVDLERVVRFARAARAQFRVQGPAEAPVDYVYPEPVATVLQIMDNPRTDSIESKKLLDILHTMGYSEVTFEKLAASLKVLGVSPSRPYIDGKQVRGYKRSDLEKVAKVPRRIDLAPSPIDLEPDEDAGEPDDKDGGIEAANTAS